MNVYRSFLFFLAILLKEDQMFCAKNRQIITTLYVSKNIAGTKIMALYKLTQSLIPTIGMFLHTIILHYIDYHHHIVHQQGGQTTL